MIEHQIEKSKRGVVVVVGVVVNVGVVVVVPSLEVGLSVRPQVRPSVRRSVGPSGMLSLTRCESHLIAGIGTC